MKNVEKQIIIIDGNYYINRAYFRKKKQYNPYPLFEQCLIELQKHLKPTHCFIAFDRGFQFFYNKNPEKYKANRKPIADEIRKFMEDGKKIAEYHGYKVITQMGIEADNIIGSIAKRYHDKKNKIFICGNDKDLAQLIRDPYISMVKMDNISWNQDTELKRPHFVLLHEADIRQDYWVVPQQIPDFLAMVGDRVDNIVGIPKIGKTTATALLEEYGDLEEIYKEENLEKLLPFVKIKLVDNKELVFKNLKKTKINCDLKMKKILNLKDSDGKLKPSSTTS